MRDTFETSGDIRDVDLLAAFVGFWRDRATGAVSFVRGGSSAAFQIAGGEVASISSTEARFESSAILVRAGKLDASALERLAVPEGTDAALAALQAGILTKREWRWGEKIRAIEVLADLLGWTDGKYFFDADARPVAGDFTLTIPRLVLELFLRSRDRNLIDHQLGPSDAPIVRAPEFEREFSTFGLTADAESVVRLIDGKATADEIARTAPADDFAVRKLLAALTTLGLVRTEAQGEPARKDAGDALDAGISRDVGFPAVLEIVADPVPREPESEADVADFQRTPSGATAYEAPSSPHSASGSSVESPATRAIEMPPLEQPAWEMPEARRPRGTRSSGFELDPPGSVSALEAYPLPGAATSDRTTEEDEAAGRLEDGFPEPEYAERGHERARGRNRDRTSELEPGPSGAGEGLDDLAGSGGPPGGEIPPRGGPSIGAILAWTLAILIFGVGAVLLFRSRSTTSVASVGSPADARTPAPTEAARLAPTAAVPTPLRAVAAAVSPAPIPIATPVPRSAPSASRSPSPAPARPRATVPVRVAAKPTAAPAPVRPTRAPVSAAAAPSPASPRETSSGSRSEWVARAARDRKKLAGEPSVHYAIQLELACEAPSLSEAWKHDRPAGSMWVLTTKHGTRECFRVLWGRYPTLDAAKRAKAGIPAFFITPSNRPAVVSVR